MYGQDHRCRRVGRTSMKSRSSIALVACLLLVPLACSSDGDRAQGPNGSDGAAGAAGTTSTGDGDPSSFSSVEVPPGQIEAAIGKLDSLVQAELDASGLPGLSVAVVHEGDVVYAKGFGVRGVGSTDPVDENTVFPLASVSKSVGATVVASAVTDGSVSWDDPVVEHMPDFALSDPYVSAHVTIGDLYSHRSGLPEHVADKLEDLGYPRDVMLERMRLVPLDPFRITYHYTNFGMTAAAEAVARAEGEPWEQLSAERIYAPLGMSSTSSTYDEFIARPNRTSGAQLVDGTWRPTVSQRDPDAQSPAGGVSSSASDMAKWMRMVLGGGTVDGSQIISAEALAPALAPQVTSAPPSTPAGRATSYGYGFNVGVDSTGRVRFSHSGAFLLGAATAFTLVPSLDLGIVVLTAGTPIGVPEALVANFLDLAETGRSTADWSTLYRKAFEGVTEPTGELLGKPAPSDPRPARELSSYAGTFDNDFYGPAEITSGGSSLSMKLGPTEESFALTHWDGDTFSYMPPGENGDSISAVTFNTSADGRIISVNIEDLDAEGLGTFIRP